MSNSKNGGYVYSTLSNDQSYVLWGVSDQASGPRTRDKTIVVRGRANIRGEFVTPKGVMTSVSVEELEILKKVPAFQRHLKAGYISIDPHREDPDKVAKSMTTKDKSAQLTPEDYDKAGKKPPSTGKGTTKTQAA